MKDWMLFSLVVAAAAVMSCVGGIAAWSQPPGADTYGDVIEGLQLAIEPAKAKFGPTEPPEFIVSLRNASDADLVLNLGTMSADGSAQDPSGVQLLWTEDVRDGALLVCLKPRWAETLRDLILPLPAHATCTLRISLKDCWLPAFQRLKVQPRPGSYDVAAVFKGAEPRYLSDDTKGLAKLKFWTAKVKSKTTKFEVARE